jgi:hypothetical protein
MNIDVLNVQNDSTTLGGRLAGGVRLPICAANGQFGEADLSASVEITEIAGS